MLYSGSLWRAWVLAQLLCCGSSGTLGSPTMLRMDWGISQIQSNATMLEKSKWSLQSFKYIVSSDDCREVCLVNNDLLLFDNENECPPFNTANITPTSASNLWNSISLGWRSWRNFRLSQLWPTCPSHFIPSQSVIAGRTPLSGSHPLFFSWSYLVTSIAHNKVFVHLYGNPRYFLLLLCCH